MRFKKGDGIGRDQRIGRGEDEAVEDGLADERAIERIAMVLRQRIEQQRSLWEERQRRQ